MVPGSEKWAMRGSSSHLVNSVVAFRDVGVTRGMKLRRDEMDRRCWKARARWKNEAMFHYYRWDG